MSGSPENKTKAILNSIFAYSTPPLYHTQDFSFCQICTVLYFCLCCSNNRFLTLQKVNNL